MKPPVQNTKPPVQNTKPVAHAGTKPGSQPVAKPGLQPGAKPAAHAGAKPGLQHKPGQAPARTAAQRQATAEERRRAQRVHVRMPVIVHLKDKPEPLSGVTLTVSPTGGMIILPQGLAAGTKFILENAKSQQRVEVSVVRPSQLNQEGSLVPIEFLSPAPRFWNIFFPPIAN
jgi:hypothetical protein